LVGRLSKESLAIESLAIIIVAIIAIVTIVIIIAIVSLSSFPDRAWINFSSVPRWRSFHGVFQSMSDNAAPFQKMFLSS
jgi:hypothetical protein